MVTATGNQKLYSLEQITALAQVCHEANRAYCITLGDFSQVPWAETPQDIKDSAIDGVTHALDGMTPEELHANWMRFKLNSGWKLGPTKDAELRTHPCLVSYDRLPEDQRKKDALFSAIVEALR